MTARRRLITACGGEHQIACSIGALEVIARHEPRLFMLLARLSRDGTGLEAMQPYTASLQDLRVVVDAVFEAGGSTLRADTIIAHDGLDYLRHLAEVGLLLGLLPPEGFEAEGFPGKPVAEPETAAST